MKGLLVVLLSFLFFILSNSQQSYDYQTPFSNIYKNKIWNSNGPLSGPGSNPCHGLDYLIALQHLIDRP